MRLGKTVKKTTPDDRVVLERRMIRLVQALVLDRSRCVGCRDCEAVCPAAAISSSAPRVEEGALRAPIRVDIDPGSCHFCGLCVVICPTRALSWRENNEETPALIGDGILPVLREGITIRVEKCNADCRYACAESCPVEAVTVRTRDAEDGSGPQVTSVDVDRTKCFFCARCEATCPYRAVEVSRARDGMIVFSPENCPRGCHACADACPSGALWVEDCRVRLEESYCVFCRACQNVCPAPEALEIRRERIRHLPLRSQLWLEIQGKLICSSAKVRLTGQSSARKRERAARTRID